MPLWHCQSYVDVFARCSHFPRTLRNPVSNFPPEWTLVQPVLFRTFNFAVHLAPSSRPTNQCRAISSAPILIRHIAVLVCPPLVGFASQHSLDWLQPHSFLQLLALVFGCSLLPMDHPGLFQQHLLHVVRADHSHVLRQLPFKKPGVATGCRDHESHTSPLQQALSPASISVPSTNICLLSAVCCSLFHQFIHTPSAQNIGAMADNSSSTYKIFTSWTRGNETDDFSLAAAAICCLNFNLSVGEMAKACQRPNPSSTASSLQSSYTGCHVELGPFCHKKQPDLA